MADSTVSHQTPAPMAMAAGIGLLPFFSNQHVTGQAVPRQNNTQEKLPSSLELTEGTGSTSETYQQSLTNVAIGGLQGGHLHQQSQSKNADSNIGVRKWDSAFFLLPLYLDSLVLQPARSFTIVLSAFQS